MGAAMPDTTRIHGSPTVRSLLDMRLREPRVRFLEDEVARFAGKPLDDIIAELRQVTASPLDAEAWRRLHILISYLYHRCGASLALITNLRHEVNTALHTPHHIKE
jgi:hypothetical protein